MESPKSILEILERFFPFCHSDQKIQWTLSEKGQEYKESCNQTIVPHFAQLPNCLPEYLHRFKKST